MVVVEQVRTLVSRTIEISGATAEHEVPTSGGRRIRPDVVYVDRRAVPQLGERESMVKVGGYVIRPDGELHTQRDTIAWFDGMTERPPAWVRSVIDAADGRLI